MSAGTAQDVPPLPAGEAPVAKPGRLPVGTAVAFDREVAVEVVEGRERFETLFSNPDGSRTVVVSSEPVHFQDAAGRWQGIDSTLVTDGDGTIRNVANDWTVRFGPLASKGVSFAPAAGDALVWMAEGAADAAPVIEADGRSVRYRNVWRGVDVVYRVGPAGVEEFIELAGKGSATRLPFVLPGVSTRKEPGRSGLVATKGQTELLIGALETRDAKGRGVDIEASTRLDAVARGSDTSLAISIDQAWLARQPADAFPVVIDPTVSVPVLVTKSHPKPGQGYTATSDLRMGNPAIAGKPAMIWRAIAEFDYDSGANNLLGKRVTDAQLTVTTTNGGGSGAQGFKVYWAQENGYHNTVLPRILPPPYPYGNAWTQFGAGTLNAVGSTATMNVTGLIDYWTSNSLANQQLLFRADNEPTNGTFTMKNFSVSMAITYNSPPSAPTVAVGNNPADGSRWWALPTFLETAESTDADTPSTSLLYRVEFGSDSTFSGGVVTASNWEPYYTFPPVGALFLNIDWRALDAGQTYHWRIVVSDGWYVVPSTTRTMIWDPDPAASPTGGAGPFSVNQASGSYYTSVSTPSFSSVGGGIGAELSYSSAERVPYGVLRTSWRDANVNGVVDAGERVVERHYVGVVDSQWGTSGPTADAVDNFISEWTGYIQPSGASWQIGLACDQKAKVWVNNVVVLDKMTTGQCSAVTTAGAIDWATGTVATSAQTIKVQLLETTGSARASLFARQGTGTPMAVPSSWLTSEVRTLPVGWSFSAGPATFSFVEATVDGDTLTLTAPDGTTVDWTRPAGSTSSQGWKPEAGEEGFASQGVDGTISVSSGGMTYLFNANGTLRQVVTNVDDQNRSSAALYTYDASARPTKVSDPVTGRQLRFLYQGQSGCPTTVIPTGYLCAVQFARSDTDPTPELWTLLTYSSSAAGATLVKVTNYPDTANPNALDKNETWEFGYGGTAVTTVRDPLAFDAIRSGAWTGTAAETVWDLGFDAVVPGWGLYWSTVGSITGPAPTPGAARPFIDYISGANYNNRGFTQIDTKIGGTTPPAGYNSRVVLDSKARPVQSYDAAGRLSTTTWDNDDRVTESSDSLGRKFVTYYDVSGNALEEWGPVPASNTACWSALQARTDPSTVFPAACADVPVVETDYDFDVATGLEFTGLDVTWWANSNLAPTTAEPRPAYNAKGGLIYADWGAGGPPNVKNSAGVNVVDNLSFEATGVMVFPTTGTYTLKLVADDKASLWIDDTLLIGDAGPTGTTYAIAATAGTRYRTRMTYVETTGNAKVLFTWTPPGGTEVAVPASALRPDYGFATRVRTYTAAGGVADEQLFTLPLPARGEVTESADGVLKTTYTYETPGTGWGRTLTRTLPAGNSWSYTYYGDTATLATATCGVAAGTVQSGLLRKRVGPDPDGAGAEKRRVEEFLYDIYGSQRGSRVGLEGATLLELDATVPWSCVSSIDGRQRPLTRTFPAHGIYPARTVTVDHAKNGNPLVTEVCDNNVTGSPTATTDSCASKSGVVTSAVDLLGRSASYTDVWAKTTTTSYDQAGRVVQAVGTAGTFAFEYTAEGQLWKHKLDGVALATLAYNTGGELQSIAYSNGTGLADLDAPGRRFTDRSVKELTFTGPGATVITSNTITERDRNQRVTKETIDGKEHRYSYDNYERLVQAQYGNTGFTVAEKDWQYCYQDAVGTGGAATNCTAGDVNAAGKNSNRTASYVDGVKTAGFVYDTADRLTGVSLLAPYAGLPISYDSRGNTYMMAGEVLEYDGADRHLRTTKGLNSVSYLRDVTDRIVGRVGNDGTQRYSHGVGGDTSSAVLDASSVVVQSTVSLPGGVMVTVAGATQTWSYPNLQGSVVATANAAGVKQGTSFFYDPFGNSVTAGALPDNSTGDLDYGYLGQYQRPVEHNVGLRQQAEMGARGYDAQLGRFLEVDPIEGGVDNDYGYVSDPRGSTDLDGECADVALSSVVLAEFAFSWRNVVDVATLECGIANGKGAYGWRHIRLSHWGGVLNASVKKLIKLVLKCARAHTVTPGRAGGGRAIWVVTAGFGLRFRIRGFEKKVPVGEVVVVLLKRKKSYTILTAYIKGNLLGNVQLPADLGIPDKPPGC